MCSQRNTSSIVIEVLEDELIFESRIPGQPSTLEKYSWQVLTWPQTETSQVADVRPLSVIGAGIVWPEECLKE